MSIQPYLTHQPVIGPDVYIHEQACVIGQVTIGVDVSIWPMVVVRGDVAPISIGAGTNVQDGAVLHVTAHTPFNDAALPLVIGERVTIGHKAMLHACTIKDECLIGMNAVVLDGAVVEKHVLLAAGSVVAPGKRLESGFLYRGNPARQARPLTEREIAYFVYSSEHYIEIKNHYLTMADN